jgi:hypothetical protein
MGLLDEAIREHLELKRRRGADPGEVAREQQELLDTVPAEDAAASDGDGASEALEEDHAGFDGSPAPSGRELTDPGAYDTPAPTESDEPQPEGDEPHASTVGQETAELDMQSVLDESPDPSTFASPGEPTFTDAFRDDISGAGPPEDLGALEDGEASDVPRPLPGQERLSFE